MEYQVVTPSDAKYPKKLKKRLGADCPAKLYYNGPLEFLDHFTLATIASDKPTGAGIRAFWDLLYAIWDYEMNHISGWYSVIETEMFHKALFTGFSHRRTEKYHSFITLFSAKGLVKESYDDFLLYRFYPPFDKFLTRDEYFRRAKDGELLMLSVVKPDEGRQLRKNIVERNFLACALSDLVYIPWAPKGSKTYTLAKKVVQAKIPVFTVDRELLIENKVNEWDPDFDRLYRLGIPGYNRKTLKPVLEQMGAKLYVYKEPIIDMTHHISPADKNASDNKMIQYELPEVKKIMVKEPVQHNLFKKKKYSKK